MKHFSGDLERALSEGRPFAIVTLLKVEGHVPQDRGAKAIVTLDGLFSGTVGGGKLEARAIQLSQDLLRDQVRTPHIESLNLQTDLGMTCGGSAVVSIEPVYPTRWTVAVFGAGHVAQALAPILATLDCEVTIIDERRDWLDRIKDGPRLKKVCQLNGADCVSEFPAGTHYVVCTPGHAKDLPVLRAVLSRGDFGFVGVIGSVVKKRSLRAALLADGFTETEVARFETPMGLPIGTNAPAEIAISITARLLQIRDQS